MPTTVAFHHILKGFIYMKNITERIIELISASPTPYHAVENTENVLKENGFTRFDIGASGSTAPNKFYITRTGVTGECGTALIAVVLPTNENGETVKPRGLHIVSSHTDSPCFRLKPNAVMDNGVYCRLNTERYGGGIWSSWLDRPLAIAGRVLFECDGKLCAKNVKLDGNVVIPNVAIHMNRQVNEGYAYNAASDLVPLFGGKGAGKVFTEKLCKAAGCTEEQLLDYDLSVYNAADGMIWGAESEFFSSPRIDDLQCAVASLLGFVAADAPKDYASVLALFDCEEVGSTCVSGADSDLLRLAAEKVSEATGVTVAALEAGSFMLSADNGHALHPNRPEFCDPTNRPVLGGGILLKYNTTKRYITDGESGAYVRLLCKKNGIPFQTFANRSDMMGGSTLGNISGTQFAVQGADIGLAQLAMHSSYETAACADSDAMMELTKVFFSE